MPPSTRFKRGAIPTPRHKLVAAERFIARPIVTARPIVVPSFLEMWLNDQYGDCVTAEEAAAIAFYSTMLGLPEIKITDATVQAFCNAYGFLDGAMLTDVMDKMISAGFQQDQGYKDGPYAAVDYSNEAALQSALESGPVKIGIDASALPSGAGNATGWYASGGSPGQFTNEDHCVGIWNHGSASDLFAALKTPVPSGFPANGYHVYTWSTVGVVDHPWIMSTCGEAWARNPTTVGLGPVPPPVPPPGPPPAPGVLSGSLSVTGPADAVGSYLIGSAGLTPSQIATLKQADQLLLSLLPPGHTTPSPLDIAAIYQVVHQRGLNPAVNWVQLIADIVKASADLTAKNWIVFLTVDIPAILADLRA